MNALDRVIYEAAVKEVILHTNAVVVADMHTGEVLYASEPANAIFGWSNDELIGQCVDVLLPAELRQRHAEYRRLFALAPHRRIMGTGTVLRAQHKNGSVFPVQIALSPISVLGKDAVVVTVVDLTEPVKTASLIQHTVDDSVLESGILKRG